MIGKVVVVILVLLALGLLAYANSDGSTFDAEFVESADASADGSESGSASWSGTVASATASFADGQCTFTASQVGPDYTYAVHCVPPTGFVWRGTSFAGCTTAMVEWPPDVVTPHDLVGEFRDMHGDCGPGTVTVHLTMLDGTPYDLALVLATGTLESGLPTAS